MDTEASRLPDELRIAYEAGLEQGRSQSAAEIAVLRVELAVVRAENAELRQRLGVVEALGDKLRVRAEMNSSNSSLPPSSDRPGDRERLKQARKAERDSPKADKPKGEGGNLAEQPKSAKQRKRGAQPGHKGAYRNDPTPPDEVVELWPQLCPRCQMILPEGLPEAKPCTRRKVWDFEPQERRFLVVEFRGHVVRCPTCHKLVRGTVPKSHFGAGMIAYVASLHGVLHAGYREIARWLHSWFGMPISLGEVAALCERTASALASLHQEIARVVRQSRVVNADETPWRIAGKGAWVWAATNGQETLFLVKPNRKGDNVEELLGSDFAGIVGSDRFKGYDRIPVEQRQVCHAHLIRNFRGLVSWGGETGKLGTALLECEAKVFTAWHAFVEAGRTDRAKLKADLAPTQDEMHKLLEDARARAPTYEFARDLLKVWPALWTFAEVEGVEPTNNEAERVLRPVVIWRKISFGTWSDWGCRFVERMASVVATCRQKGTDVVQALISAIRDWQANPSPAPATL
jgi:transposase